MYCVVNLKRKQPVNTFLLFERDETSMQLSFVAAPVDKPLTIFSRATFNDFFFFFFVMKGVLFGCENLKLLRKCQTFHIGAPATRQWSRKRVFLTGPPPPLLGCVAGGDRDESDDTVGDLRRTESDSVLKKVGISAANYPPLRMRDASTLQWDPGAMCGGAFVLQH